MVDTKSFYNYLKSNELNFFTGVPDSLLANFCACVKQNANVNDFIITANEGNAVAMCAGYYLSTGRIGVVFMQNSGEGNAVNPLLSLADEEVYSIPMLLIIGWRGEPGVHDEPQHIKQGKVTCDLLDAMRIKYSIAEENYEGQLSYAIDYMKSSKRPYALVVKKGYFTEYKILPEKTNYDLTREDALKILINRIDDDIIVSTTGKTSREIYEIRESNHQKHCNDFLTVGSMGHTASIAYGMALGTKKNIWCVDGDGSFIMHMGSLGVIGANILPNFKYIVNDNQAHESVGGQPTCSKTLDIPMILKGCGFEKVLVAETVAEINSAIDVMKEEKKAALVLHTRQGSRDNLGRPKSSPQENKIALMEKLGSI